MPTHVTRAAEGFDRRSFTVAEILRMQDAGIISDEENFEPIEGEIVPMQAKTHIHELVKSALTLAVARATRPPLAGGGNLDLSKRQHFRRAGSRHLSQRHRARGGQGFGHPTGDRSRSDEPRLRPGPEGAPLCAPWRQRAVGDRHAERRRRFVQGGPGPVGWRSIAERSRDEGLPFAALPGFSVGLGSI